MIHSRDKALALAFASEKWGESLVWDKYAALTFEKEGDIQAVVLYKNWIPANSIEMHVAAVAGGRWLTRSFLRAAFHYPFRQLGLRRVTGLVAADNSQSVRFVEHLGFVLEGRTREGWAQGLDALVYGMLKRECRFIDGEKIRRSNSARSREGCPSANGVQPKHGGGERQS